MGLEHAEDPEDKPKIMKRPYTPTRQEVEEHMATHMPFRSLCPHCVAGRAVAGPHVHGDRSSEMGITWSMDFCFLSSLDRDEQTAPILVFYDDYLGTIWALGVESKELNKVIVYYALRRLDVSGHRGGECCFKV